MNSLQMSGADKQHVAKSLGKVMADTFLLSFKTHVFHWNVSGPYFPSLHKLFEEQYEELDAAVDTVAERIRALQHQTSINLQDVCQAGSIPAATKLPSALNMVRELLQGHEQVIADLRKAVKACEEAEDPGTEDMLTSRLFEHEKHAWMLRATLEE